MGDNRDENSNGEGGGADRGGDGDGEGGGSSQHVSEEEKKRRAEQEAAKDLYWQLLEARLLFGFDRDDEELNLRDTLSDKIELLKKRTRAKRDMSL